MPRLRRWLVPFAALIAAASTRAGAEAAPQTLPDPPAPAPDARAARAAQAHTNVALVQRNERRRAGSGKTARLLDTARAQIGDGYAFGGSGPDAFDCSGLTMQAWAAGGVSLPHFASAQYAQSQPVSLDALRPGDLIFYATDPTDYTTIYHVGLYVGGGQMIEAPHTGDVVKYASIYGQSNLFGAARP